MFSSGPNYSKLKTNLRLAINRLKLLEKKKTELALKARKEIADYISTGKLERAKIRVEHIIREDYLVEAMEVTEMYCDLLLARFGLIQQMKDLDEGLAEAISSLIWVTPRLMTDVQELKIISDHLSIKYGKPYAQACREQAVGTISDKLIHKLSVQAPPKILVEKYLVEIAKNYNIEYEPDPQVMRESEWAKESLIELNDGKNDLGGSGGTPGASGGGGGGMNIPPIGFTHPNQSTGSYSPFDYPQELQTSKKKKVDLSTFVPSILLTNPQSLANCFDSFVERVREKDPDIVAVSETWFSESKPASQFEMDGYTLFHDDRENRRGGGVALYIRTRLVPYTTAIEVPSILECIWAAIGPSLYICALYHAPRSPTGKLLIEHIVNTVLDLRSSSRNQVRVIVTGDMNDLPHERLFSSLRLQNLVKEPTHRNSVIDVILSDSPHLFDEPLLLPPIGNSEHHCVFIKPSFNRNYPDAYNLPNLTPSHNFAPPGPPPPDMSADTLSNNFKSGFSSNHKTESKGSSSHWDALMGLENSPPPSYSSAVNPSASAPPQNFPPTSLGGMGHEQERPVFPPDVFSQGGSNLKDSNSPKPAPRSKLNNSSDANDYQLPDLPDLPNVPDFPNVPTAPKQNNQDDGPDDIDFDDLNKRFEQLKKKK